MSPPFRGFYEFSLLLFLSPGELVIFLSVTSLSHTCSYYYIHQTDRLSLYSKLLDRGIIVHLSLVISNHSRGSGSEKVLTKHLFIKIKI